MGNAAGVEFSGDGVEVGESLVYGERAHFLSEAVSGFKRLLEVVSGNFDGECVGDHLAGALVVFNPSGMRECNPYGTPVDEEFEIDGIGMAGRDGDDQGLVDAVDFFLGPAIDGFEIFVHDEK